MDCPHCEYETNCELPCVKSPAPGARKPTVKDTKLLDAYRFVFSRHFLKDDKLISALKTWQPDIYKLISLDIKS